MFQLTQLLNFIAMDFSFPKASFDTLLHKDIQQKYWHYIQ